MITDPQNPQHWLLLARERLEKADALYREFGSSYADYVNLRQEAGELIALILASVPPASQPGESQ